MKTFLQLGLALLFPPFLIACADAVERGDRAASSPTPSLSKRTENPPMAPTAPSVASNLDRVRQAVDSALGRERLGLTLSPALPVDWSSLGSAVCFYGYATEALPTGVSAFHIVGPKVKVVVDPSTGSVVVEHLDGSDVSQRESSPIESGPDLANGEQALLDVLAGTRTRESAKTALLAYSRWATPHRILGADARKRAPAFFQWLDGVEIRPAR